MATISRIYAENFLSLDKFDLDLGRLNVLVGPNGAGKTNILRLFQFLGDVARSDLVPAIDLMGGFDHVIFRGVERKTRSVQIRFEGVITQHASERALDVYRLTFWQHRMGSISAPDDGRRVIQRQESIAIKRTAGRGRRITLKGGSVRVVVTGPDGRTIDTAPRELRLQNAASGLATLRRLGDEYEAAGVDALARVFEQLRLFEIDVGRVRRPGRFTSSESLRADASNLANYLQHIRSEHPEIFATISDDVRFVLPSFERFEFISLGGSDDNMRVDIVESKLTGTTPLARASYGTIRAIALFAMLNDPNPPNLTCLEEIDHGLHPHALDRVVERLREASKKTQIILATHSPALVNRLDPDELVVVERNAETGGTKAMRPSRSLVESLEHETGYALGELWFSGTIGGVL